jgi:hypothetical protein
MSKLMRIGRIVRYAVNFQYGPINVFAIIDVLTFPLSQETRRSLPNR